VGTSGSLRPGRGGLRDMMSLAIPRALAQDVRSGNLFSKRGSAVLDAPEMGRVAAGSGLPGGKRRASVSEMPLRRDATYADDYIDNFDEDGEFTGKTRRGGARLGMRSMLLPKTLWGRIGVGTGLVVLLGGTIAGMLAVRSYLLHDEHFTVPGSAAIQIAGNSHMTRAQLLSVFGEDVDRNVFRVPLVQRRAELESLPWIAHATVMRLLPNRVRVAIVERTPVAFVRQGSQIGLVDANGVLLELPGPEVDSGGGPGATKATHYSFPVLTGISSANPLAARAARMRTYLGFMQALDATGENLSQRVSEVDLSDPEDVRAIISASAAGPTSDKAGEILVHFGDENFLERYHRYQAHLAEWRAQYPRLAAVDLRYERQAVLEMQPGTAVPNADAAAVSVGTTGPAPGAAKPAVSVVIRPAAVHGAAKHLAVATKPVAKSPVAASTTKPSTPFSTPLTTAFPVTPLGAKLGRKPASASTVTGPPAAQQGVPR
jgi:cell division protein FtsQ